MVDKTTQTDKMNRRKFNYSLFYAFILLMSSQCVLSSSEESTGVDDFSEIGANIWKKYELSLSYDYEETSVDDVIDSTCMAYLRLYSDLAANFTRCSIVHARPLRFCENCVTEYVEAKSVFDYLMQGHGHDDQGRPCSDVILNADRTQVVVLTNRFINTLWDSSYCKNCFDVYHESNGTVEAHLNNDTLRFIELINETQECFNNYTDEFKVLMQQNVTGNHNVCTMCLAVYKELNVHYYAMENHFDKHICMDIADTMNYTRKAWSKSYGCTLLAKQSWVVGVVSAVLSLLPIFFYGCNYWQGRSGKQPKLVKQKRLRAVPTSVDDPAVPSCSTDSG